MEAQKERESAQTSVTVFSRTHSPKAIREMLGTAYNGAVAGAMQEFKNEAGGYQKRIMDALRAGNMDEAIRIRDSMPEYLGFNEERQKVEIGLGVEGGMRKVKQTFIDGAMEVLDSCLFAKGEETTLISRISFGSSMYAKLLGPRLAETLAAPRPSPQELKASIPPGEDRIPFAQATIPKGKLPIVIETHGDTIEVRYADWIAMAGRKQEHED